MLTATALFSYAYGAAGPIPTIQELEAEDAKADDIDFPFQEQDTAEPGTLPDRSPDLLQRSLPDRPVLILMNNVASIAYSLHTESKMLPKACMMSALFACVSICVPNIRVLVLHKLQVGRL